MKLKYISTLVTSFLLIACSQEVTEQGRNMNQASRDLTIWPKIQSEVKVDPLIEARIDEILAQMSLEQKVAQMIQPEIRDITVEDMRRYGFGSYLNGGGAFPNNNKHATPSDWIDLAEAMYQASIDDSLDGSTIPTMWGTDAVHGHNNVIGATLFPHNIGLGAANNAELIEKIARVTATEVMVTGIDWVFAPTVATVRDDRWGRTYEGYSEDPEIVKAYAKSIVRGLQGTAQSDFLGDKQVISTVKHFIGDGGTENGDDQGNNTLSEQELFDIHAQGYVSGLAVGAQSVMASFNSWQGEKIHGSKYLLTDVLKNRMGFDGFVVGDWNGHGQIPGCSNDNCPNAVNAGLDIYMVPTDAWKPLLENTIDQVKQGIIPLTRIDDAVSRILRVKLRAGIFDKPSPANREFSGKVELLGSKEHRDVAKQAVRESLVLLKNDNNILPLSPKLNVLVAGDAADNIGKQSGGWTITWQGTNNTNLDFPGGSSIYDGLAEQIIASGGQVQYSVTGQFNAKPDVAIVVFGEEPYAEGQGDRDNLAYQQENPKDLALLKSLKAQGIPVVSVFISGRPMWVNAELNASNAFVAAWLPGSEGSAIADVLLKDKENHVQHDFKGKLSFSWPKFFNQVVNRFDENYQPLFPYGFGLTYKDTDKLGDDLAEDFQQVSQVQDMRFFEGKVISPWRLSVVSGAQSLAVTSNSHSLTGISYRTVDKQVQEDAFRVEFSGDEKSAIKFEQAYDPLTEANLKIQTNIKDNSTLLLTLKRESEVNAPVIINLSCEAEDTLNKGCTSRFDISQQLASAPLAKWHTIKISLKCLTASDKLKESGLSSLTLSSSGAATFSLSDVRIQSQASGTNTQCD